MRKSAQFTLSKKKIKFLTCGKYMNGKDIASALYIRNRAKLNNDFTTHVDE